MNIYYDRPNIANNVFIAPNACVIGNVKINSQSSIWYNAVVKGDFDSVEIGNCSNVQEGVIINSIEQNNIKKQTKVKIGNFVTIGHGAKLSGCEVGDNSLIGMGAIISQGVKIGSGSLVGAGSVVKPDTIINDGELWTGNPAKFKRKMSDKEIKGLLKQATDYHICAENHKKEYADIDDYYTQGCKIFQINEEHH